MRTLAWTSRSGTARKQYTETQVSLHVVAPTYTSPQITLERSLSTAPHHLANAFHAPQQYDELRECGASSNNTTIPYSRSSVLQLHPRVRTSACSSSSTFSIFTSPLSNSFLIHLPRSCNTTLFTKSGAGSSAEHSHKHTLAPALRFRFHEQRKSEQRHVNAPSAHQRLDSIFGAPSKYILTLIHRHKYAHFICCSHAEAEGHSMVR